jgi:hypothetical protein
MHGVGSVIYWGNKEGTFSLSNTSQVPSFGPHSRIAADAGSLGRRNGYELYTSDNITNTTKSGKLKLTIDGAFNAKQFVVPQILTGNSGDKVMNVVPVLVSQNAGQVVYQVNIAKGQTFRYQLKLNSSNTGAGPVISSVQMEEMK